MKISRNLSKHLKIAVELLSVKIQVWTGREPFPGQPLVNYKRMLDDVLLEQHDVEVVDTAPLTERQVCVLREYRSLVDDYVLYLYDRQPEEATKYSRALESVDQMLDEWFNGQPVPGWPDPFKMNPPVTRRPDVRCAEKGACQIKVMTVVHKADAAFQINGQWTFGDEDTHMQNRECMKCGRTWETRFKQGEALGTIQTKAGSGVVL